MSAPAKNIEKVVAEEGDQNQTGEARAEQRSPREHQCISAAKVRMHDRFAINSDHSPNDAAGDPVE